MKKRFWLKLFLILPFVLTLTTVFAGRVSAASYSFPEYTVTNVLIIPSDTTYDDSLPQQIADGVRKVQARYAQLIDGQTFRINTDNGDVIVIKSDKTLQQICNNDCANMFNVNKFLGTQGFPIDETGDVNKQGVVLNVFLDGASISAGGWGTWSDKYNSGSTYMGEMVLSGFKGVIDRKTDLLCQAYLGRTCSEEYSLYVIMHELGHSFGLLMASRWSYVHPCTTITTRECKFDLDKKYIPGPEEANGSIMGYGSNSGQLSISFNDSCVNPEKTLLRHSKYFGGPGYASLNFENCLTTPVIQLTITGIGQGNTFQEGDQISINVDGLLPSDNDIQVIFPGNNPSRKVEKDGTTIKAIVPNTQSGDLIVSAQRGNSIIARSNPYPVVIRSLNPVVQKVEPFRANLGQEMTLFGNNFNYDTDNLHVRASRINIAGIEITNFKEVSNDKIIFEIPKLAKVGPQAVAVITLQLDSNSQITREIMSNSIRLEVLPDSSFQVDLKAQNYNYFVGDSLPISGKVLVHNSQIDHADILIKNFSLSCDQKVGEWCKLTSVKLYDGVEAQIQSSYIPQFEGFYQVTIQLVLANGEILCSGETSSKDQKPDCGPNSEFSFMADKKIDQSKEGSLHGTFQIKNESDNPVKITPMVCSTDAIRSCVGAGKGIEIAAQSDFTANVDYVSNPAFKVIPGKTYSITCYVSSDLIAGTPPCPYRYVQSGEQATTLIQIKGSQVTFPDKFDTPQQQSEGCDLQASQSEIKVGDSITWKVATNPSGAKAFWTGISNGVTIVPQELEDFANKTSWEKTYQYNEPGEHQRAVNIEDSEGSTFCTTKTVTVKVLAKDRSVSSIVLSLLGQSYDLIAQKVARIHLPGTENQNGSFPLTVEVHYADGGVNYQTIMFNYKVPTQGNICVGKCGDADGKTAEGYRCTGWVQGQFANCQNGQYPYCFNCPEIVAPVSSSIPTPTPTPSTTNLPQTACTTAGGVCVDSAGKSVDGRITCNNYLGDELSKSSCAQYYYCWSQCTGLGPTPTPTPTPVGGGNACISAGGVCADSGGTTQDGTKKCLTYLGDNLSSSSCSQYYYCWKDCN